MANIEVGQLMRKVSHYRRAVWLVDNGPTLEALIRTYLNQSPDVVSTKFVYGTDIDVQIAERSINGRGIGIYFTLYTEGRRTATVENGGSSVNRRNAPRGEEFLKTGIVIMIEGNNVAYIADGHTNDAQITNLFHCAFKAQNFPDETTQFGLMPKMNEDQLQRLIQRGVKSIDLGITSFNATIDQINNAGGNSDWLEPFAAMGEALINAFGRDRTPLEAEAASHIEATIHLGYDGRSRNTLIPQVLANLAHGVEELGSQFKIVTTDDVVITHEKLVIRAEIDVDGDEVAIDAQSAFTPLRMIMSTWRRSGIFEQ
ncbi:hypothetical protein P8H26_13725 [Pseudochrobactrum sp. sp1633]|uniref:hypothetical protein n=1 Tax=Pseudochrobactrum sp. sp1633 TaxID=3036706 RepID=UPI0025A59EB5|nr:hypothetical protein [Pseudochrobactrum sp. sp1633]MDM8346453.1 hypothetical protein [Pseudochrobactrum sp. sp1633]